MVLLALGLLVGLSGQAWAQDEAPKTATVAPPVKDAAKGPPNRPPGDRGQFAGLFRLIFRLNTLELTPEQKTKVQALLDDVQKKITEDVLNPEQRDKLAKPPADAGGQKRGPGPGQGQGRHGAQDGGKGGKDARHGNAGGPPPPPPPPAGDK